MITALELRDFKNFAEEKLNVGPFNLIVGANASGKSNLNPSRLRLLLDLIEGQTPKGGVQVVTRSPSPGRKNGDEQPT